MRKKSVLTAIALGIGCCPTAGAACVVPPFSAMTQEMIDDSARSYIREFPILVEAIVVQAADPGYGRGVKKGKMRITRVYQGDIKPGTIIATAEYPCATSSTDKGTGLIHLNPGQKVASSTFLHPRVAEAIVRELRNRPPSTSLIER